MVAPDRNPDVLAEVAGRVLDAGAAEFGGELDADRQGGMAFRGAVGVGVAAFPSDSADAQELRRQLYTVRKKGRKIIHAGVEYRLRVKIFVSFGEDAFRVTMTRS